MADPTGPNLLVVGGDTKRLQWLTHHVTSHWPDAQVTTVPAGESARFEPPDRRAGAGRRDLASRLRRRSGRLHRTGAHDPDAADAAWVALHFPRRKRRRDLRGPHSQRRRQGLLAARTHYPRINCWRPSRRRCPSAAPPRGRAKTLTHPSAEDLGHRGARLYDRQGNRHQ